MNMKWEDFVALCERAVTGSSEKLEQMKGKGKKVSFRESVLTDPNISKPSEALSMMFNFGTGMEWGYWRDLKLCLLHIEKNE